MEMILHHVQTPPPPPQKVRPDLALPPAVGALLMRALQKDPGRRFRTAEEMEAALEALTALPATARSPRPGPTARPTPRPAASTAIEVEPILTPARPRTSATRVRPPVTAPPEEEAASRSSAGALIGSALVILAVVGAVAWRSSARARPLPPAAGPPVEAPAATRPALVEAAPVAGPVASDSDARIQNEIQRLFMSSSTLRTQPIVVEVANGIVTLSGSVGDSVSSQLAESFAASVAGVRRVFSTVRVPAAAPAAAAAGAVDATTSAGEGPPAQPPRASAEEERESPRELLDKAKRELAAGNLPGAMAACQAVLRIEPANPMARECVQRLEGRLGGPPRRR